MLSLIAVGVVASLSVAYLQLSATVTRSQAAASDVKLSFYLAEAGLAEAYSGLQVGRTGNVGSESKPVILGDGLFWVEATELDDDHLQLDSTGMAKSGKAELSMVIRKGSTNVGGLGIFSEDDLVIGDGTLIDGYDSTLGDYETQKLADPASVQLASLGGNGDITITAARAPTEIHGDVAAGPAGAVNLVGTPTITGTSEAHGSLMLLDPVVVPTTTMYAGVTQAMGPPLVVPSGVYGAQFVTLEADAELELQGPLTLVLNGLQVAAGAEVVFDTSAGDIEVFVANTLTLDPAAVLTCIEEDPRDVTINVVGEATVDLAAAGKFYGLIYAPETEVVVGASFELFGGLVAEKLSLADGATLHYDRALLPEGAEDAVPKLLSWRILELGDSSPDTLSINPFDILGVDPSICTKPSESHEDQLIGVRYYDTTSTLQVYTGLESNFDWGDVRVVVEMKRSGGLVEDNIVELAVDGVLKIAGLK